MRIEVCVEFEVTDVDLMLRASRALGMPLDAMIKTAVANFIARTLAPPSLPSPKPEEGEKR
jgi:hypothetical protein